VAVRDIIEIDESLCDGCGDCVTACAEGAIQIIDGKARLVKDIYCDGLGACLGHCPQGALTVMRREADAFDEKAVALHLARHRESVELPQMPHHGGGCPGSRTQSFAAPRPASDAGLTSGSPSRLSQWPIQLHLLPPEAPFLRGSKLLVAADCVAYSLGGFHDRFLAEHSLAIACPKLDSHQEIYLAKLTAMIDQGGVQSLTVMVMEVPCCGGLVRLVEQAAANAARKIPATLRIVSIRGEILAEHQIAAA
jgi:NAD-dependent dihydropyrimidine dehydrogenase PreA subunit